MVAAYSYMALVPIVQPPVIKLLTTNARSGGSACRTAQHEVSQTTKILFPIIITVRCGIWFRRAAWRWSAF